MRAHIGRPWRRAARRRRHHTSMSADPGRASVRSCAPGHNSSTSSWSSPESCGRQKSARKRRRTGRVAPGSFRTPSRASDSSSPGSYRRPTRILQASEQQPSCGQPRATGIAHRQPRWRPNRLIPARTKAGATRGVTSGLLFARSATVPSAHKSCRTLSPPQPLWLEQHF